EESTRRLALEKGDIDWEQVNSSDAWAALKNVQGVNVNSDPTLNQMFFAFHVRNKYLSDVRVRQALALVFDYRGYAETIRSGHSDVAAGPYPKAIPFHDDSIPPLEMNIEQAKKLMAEAGYPNGGFSLT